jgi:quercetin dioxygenase-like cupin family protein
VSAFSDLGTIEPQQIWDGVLGRTVHGDRVTLSYVELEPGVAVPEHSHENEQLGMVLNGSLTFTAGDETLELGPRQAWCIKGNVPHSVVVGPEGAVLIEIFSPVRSDWAGLPAGEQRPARWP